MTTTWFLHGTADGMGGWEKERHITSTYGVECFKDHGRVWGYLQNLGWPQSSYITKKPTPERVIDEWWKLHPCPASWQIHGILSFHCSHKIGEGPGENCKLQNLAKLTSFSRFLILLRSPLSWKLWFNWEEIATQFIYFLYLRIGCSDHQSLDEEEGWLSVTKAQLDRSQTPVVLQHNGATSAQPSIYYIITNRRST